MSKRNVRRSPELLKLSAALAWKKRILILFKGLNDEADAENKSCETDYRLYPCIKGRKNN